MGVIDIVSKVGGDLDVLVVAVGPQPPVTFVTVLRAQRIGIKIGDLAKFEGLAHVPPSLAETHTTRGRLFQSSDIIPSQSSRDEDISRPNNQ